MIDQKFIIEGTSYDIKCMNTPEGKEEFGEDGLEFTSVCTVSKEHYLVFENEGSGCEFFLTPEGQWVDEECWTTLVSVEPIPINKMIN